MEAEHVEILNFIKQYAPFTILPEAELQTISQQIEVGYFQKGDQVLDYNQPISDLHVIRSGAIETYKRNGELFNRLSAGGFFGEAGLLRKGRVRYPVKALEDSLIYYVPGALFNRLYDEYDAFADAVEVEEHQRVNLAVREREQRNDLFIETVETLLSRQPVIIESDASIVEAAQKMTDEQVSSLLICGDNPDDVLGIITDKDLRKRVLAVERSPSDPVRDVMSSNLVYIEHNQRIFEAMLTMLRTNLHHLPVLKKQRLIGVIALSDVVRHESKSSLYVVSSIFKQNTFEELAQLKESVEASFVRLVNEDANSRMIGSA
ncbi:MAG TPA: cyclic nucleotide-binding protein, partial [Idiomarina sp.]|nr:cyclic nucleotide-binding protein [Idiomarina sp.]